MAWIRTVPLSEGDEKLRQAIEGQKGLYPIEYATPVHPTGDGTSGIVASHSLIPDALFHAFATFGALMSPDLPLSAAAAEDADFCRHWGFDVAGIRAAMADTGRVRGGSTISQQVVKNVFLWPERSWLRKGIEAGLTLLVETLWPKRRIMEVYLNVAEMGEGVFGAVLSLRDVTELDQAVQVKTDFVANASHELRTPVAAIRTAAETLESAATDDPKMAERLRGRPSPMCAA